jgi:hypothetical protein
MTHQTATKERLARIPKGSLARAKTDTRVDAKHDRIIPIFENMARRGQITPDERSAGEKYAALWFGARKQSGLVGAYGDQRWSGTSAGHSSLTREEWPVHCAREVARANAAIGDPNMVKLLDRIVEADATLEDIGRAHMGYVSADKAMASGATTVKFALGRLVRHFGYSQRVGP